MVPLSIGPLIEKCLGLQVLPTPPELPALPIYMIWHETRSNDSAHRWLRELVVTKLRLEPGKLDRRSPASFAGRCSDVVTESA
jgi:DNA-binding transcriptional LysR family regulator